MSLLQQPNYKAQEFKRFEITMPCSGGINTKDLPYELEDNQTPDTLNMMYRNGQFGKRFGQEFVGNNIYNDVIYGIGSYNDTLLVHCGSRIYENGIDVAASVPKEKGTFIRFNKLLYYLCGGNYFVYDGETWQDVEPYIPDVIINRSPNPEAKLDNTDTMSGDGVSVLFPLSRGSITEDAVTVKISNVTQDPTTYGINRTAGTITFNTAPASGVGNITVQYKYYKNNSEGDEVDNFNRLGSAFNISYHGDGESTIYHLFKGENNKFLPYDVTKPKVEVSGVKLAENTYTYDKDLGTITFNTAPAQGTNNVVITCYKTQQDYIDSIMNCKYWIAYGGSNNSRLFLAGNGESCYYYSDVFDGTYFPDNNYAYVGNSNFDITGFGEQYDSLIVFKPTEMFKVDYNYTSSDEGAYFSSSTINARMGCIAPGSIQLINNRLTWLSKSGVATLVSSVVENERNVRLISRNVDTQLLLEVDLEEAQSADFDNKYILSLNGNAYVWDYQLSPYVYTTSSETQPRKLSWFKFDNIYANQFYEFNRELYLGRINKLVKLNNSFTDFGQAISSHYQTPYLQFNAVEYLKTIKNIYIQCRGDTASFIDIDYFTEDTPNGERDQEAIAIGTSIWRVFEWNSFTWDRLNIGYTFRRKCSLKKVQMASIKLSNSETNRDMSISHMALDYAVIKAIK